jgi:hypothetical protein
MSLSTAAGPPESDSKKPTNMSMDDRYSSQNSGNWNTGNRGWTAAETIGNKNNKDVNSRRETRRSVETPTTLLASAWTPTATKMPETV